MNKLKFELQQKDDELKVIKDKASEFVGRINQLVEEQDQKVDGSLLGNLLLKYFQSPDDKRADIMKVIGGLLGWSTTQILELGTGAPPSGISSWISNLWSYGAGTPKQRDSVSTS